MKILKAIGGFFVKIWRWIKETAWVQPLLIVGAIFAIIFSIPYFTEWINSIGIGSENYYSAHKVSLEGELEINADPTAPTSAVDKLVYSMDQNSFLGTDEAFEGYDADYSQIGGKCNTADEFIEKINGFIVSPRPRFNTYSRQLFLERYSESTVVESLRKILFEY